MCNGKQYNSEIEKFLTTPESEFQNLIAGSYYTSVAYIKRGGGWSNELSQEQIDGMHEYLEKAQDKLCKEFKTDLYSVEAGARMIRILITAGDKEDSTYYFEKCKSLNPNHFMATQRYFRVLTPRWGGSNEEMLALTSSIKDKPLQYLIKVMTLNEIFNDLYHQYEEDAIELFKTHHSSLISEEIDNIHISNDDSIVSIHAKNYLAMLYNILGMKKERNRLIDELSNRVTMYPWAYYGMQCEKDVKMYRRFGLMKL